MPSTTLATSPRLLRSSSSSRMPESPRRSCPVTALTRPISSTQAGASSKGALLTCPCGPAPAAFATTYQTFAGIAPGVYSVDAYDLATIMVTGISSGKVTDRASMIEYFKTYDGEGLAKTYKWDSSGELATANPWVYEVQ